MWESVPDIKNNALPALPRVFRSFISWPGIPWYGNENATGPGVRPPYLGDLLTMAINDVLNGMILQVRANPKIFWLFCRSTLQETITYPLQKVELESMIFHFPMVGYVSSLDATFLFWETKSIKLQPLKPPERFSPAKINWNREKGLWPKLCSNLRFPGATRTSESFFLPWKNFRVVLVFFRRVFFFFNLFCLLGGNHWASWFLQSVWKISVKFDDRPK